jgi:hypothetical protein
MIQTQFVYRGEFSLFVYDSAQFVHKSLKWFKEAYS